MRVTKRDGSLETVQFDKITRRLSKLCWNLASDAVDVTRVAAAVCSSIHDCITTVRLDELAADVAQALSTHHPDYGVLAARVLVSNLQKNTVASVTQTYQALETALSPQFFDAVCRNAEALDAMLDFDRDYAFDFFGFKTAEKMYLARADGRIVERPQHMFLRVAVALWGDDMERVRETYEALSLHKFTHASPTLFNAGMRVPQLSSCYLLGVEEDSIEGIFDAVTKCAKISKYGGGIGLAVQKVRGRGAPIRGTNGTSDGLVPMLRVMNAVANYVNQSGKRKGAIAVYLEPHHPDVWDFVQLRRNQGEDHLRARELFLALWIPDIFMRRVEANAPWSLMNPSECPGLEDVWGTDYDQLYLTYESQGKYVRQIPAQELWFEILKSQIETGVPYLLFKDAANAKSNQQHLGTIHCSNLCSEIIEYTSSEEVAVCTLASMSLPAFVKHGEFDFEDFRRCVGIAARNLDRVIDVNAYPIDEARISNVRHRPVGIGVQGLQDVFFELRLAFDSPEARALNRKIFETMYFAALRASCNLARHLGPDMGPHPSFQGSPASQGKLQHHLWGEEPTATAHLLDWAGLAADVVCHGLRNSLSIAPMPTASTSQLLGNTEAMEPITSNLYSRRTLAGEFAVLNHRLVRDLLARGAWTPDLKDKIISRNGSVQHLEEVPRDLQALYKTAWELPMKALIDMAADRGPFVCQSQSLNLFVAEPTFKKLSSMHFYAWRRGLKTGCYYLRTRPAARAVQVTVDPRLDESACVMCSS